MPSILFEAVTMNYLKWQKRLKSLFWVMAAVLCFFGCSTPQIYDNVDNKIVINKVPIYYTSNVSDDEIKALSNSHEINPSDVVKLDKQGSTYLVYLVYTKTYLEGDALDDYFDSLAQAISDFAYNKSPVIVYICDNSFKVYKTFRSDPDGLVPTVDPQ
jgi:hypothetical protein